MEPKRYWWIAYGTGVWRREMCIAEHPFIWVHSYNQEVEWHQSDVVLHTWQLVSVEEYNLWNELNNKQ